MGIGYIKTLSFQSEPLNDYGQLVYLQSKTTIGLSLSPMLLGISLIGLAIICGVFIKLYKQFINRRTR